MFALIGIHVVNASDTHRQMTAGFYMARKAGITSFTK